MLINIYKVLKLAGIAIGVGRFVGILMMMGFVNFVSNQDTKCFGLI
ncbi:hypothetical protein KKG41_01585 [Patescibacteria group bacterium]|nr:hypothetical protein [Patescibacteria group bacterium]